MKKYKAYYETTSYLLINTLILLSSCLKDAPRNNPLDPRNPDYSYSELNGEVYTYRMQPIADVKVYWKNGNRLVKTNPEGCFSITEIKAENGWLTFQHDQYLNDSVFVNWNSSKKFNIGRRTLVAIPQIDSMAFYSSVEYFPEHDPRVLSTKLIMKVKLYDPDKCIDSVLAVCPYSEICTFLDYNIIEKCFERTLYWRKFIPYEIIGHDFQINVIKSVEDIFSDYINLENISIKRFVDEEIQLIEPISYNTVSPSPTLKWKNISLDFPSELLVEIYTEEMQQVWQKQRLPISSTSIKVDTELQPDNYKWAVWIIDEFKNRSRSKLKNFIVE